MNNVQHGASDASGAFFLCCKLSFLSLLIRIVPCSSEGKHNPKQTSCLVYGHMVKEEGCCSLGQKPQYYFFSHTPWIQQQHVTQWLSTWLYYGCVCVCVFVNVCAAALRDFCTQPQLKGETSLPHFAR